MRKITAFVIAAVFSIFFLQPKTANADTTFNFTGNCGIGTPNCTGMATATLVLHDYTIGNSFDNSNFVSFAYHSSFFGDVTGDVGSSTGQFVSLPGAANVTIIFNLGIFNFLSLTNGNWCAGPQCLDDGGSGGVWSVA